jgi:hypothetical protein
MNHIVKSVANSCLQVGILVIMNMSTRDLPEASSFIISDHEKLFFEEWCLLGCYAAWLL